MFLLDVAFFPSFLGTYDMAYFQLQDRPLAHSNCPLVLNVEVMVWVRLQLASRLDVGTESECLYCLYQVHVKFP